MTTLNHDIEYDFGSRLVLRGATGFEEARVGPVFNMRRPDRLPAAVLNATSEADVVAGVRLAMANDWQVSIRSGGHSWAVWSVRDDTLLIDLGGLREMSYDSETEIATATPAVRGGNELAPFLAARGRFFPGGHCPSVGLGGFLLQGGQGWDARGLGWAAEYVEAVDVVTASGDIVRADATQNTDLFWAARGAGPSFPGVVTRFHLRTLPHPERLSESMLMFTLDAYDEVFTWLHEMHHDVDPRVEIVAISATPPEPIPGRDDIDGHVLVVSAVALVDTEEEAAMALAPFEACPVADKAVASIFNVPADFDELRQRQVFANPENHRYQVDNCWIGGSAADVVPAIKKTYTTLPTRKAFTIWFSMAPLRPLPDMAFDLQSEIYLAMYIVTDDQADDALISGWLQERAREMEPVTRGQYLGDSDFTNRQVRFMSDQNYDKLQEIRARRDPDGRFVGFLCNDEGALNRNAWEHS
jgi:FAD/FMN-containing dehydrogenase